MIIFLLNAPGIYNDLTEIYGKIFKRRFAQEAKLEDIKYFSDYREGEFGLATGLLVDDLRLLARTIILVDKTGIVRYIQVVPEITRMPDMEKAFAVALELTR